ncbi:DUF6022 family protein [Cohnella silvisoli]|uniref:DUF6022 family protein n=1 Tax=Cohnella silvisoli TaxID=2873699 RepID=A0ABV1KZY9_9BACL|nr:DUF6022 family protein [Cohnella silvisoli]MCD9024715.1 DUF6022 family protein [Cohnella silvisoli]
MKTLQQFLAGKPEVTIHTLVKFMNQQLSEIWENVLQENKAELTQMFAEYGDRAYGAYIHKFMAPIGEQINETGYAMRSGFNLSDSFENWGPPEERERCAWYVIKNKDGDPLGTAVLQIYHSHTRFDIPQAPHFFALEETEREAIMNALSFAATRIHGNISSYQAVASDELIEKWEYGTDTGLGDYLKTYSGQTRYGYIDHVLSAWGRNGWELVSITPHNDLLVGFFKRPLIECQLEPAMITD